MKIARLLTAALLVSALVIPTAASAGPARDRVTGGGQILVPEDGGAGSTIAFTAQGNADDAKGQIQYIDRTNGTGQDQVRAHYTVECVVVEAPDEETVAAGYIRGIDGDGNQIYLHVVDNGEGVLAEADTVTITAASEEEGAPCNVATPETDDLIELARGNVQTYDGI